MYKPENYNDVSPYFIVNGAQRLVNMLKEVFGATELRRYEHPDGTIMHMEVQVGDSVIMLGDASEKFPAVVQVLHVYVSDAEEVFKKAIAAGCEAVQWPKKNEGDPDLRGTFTDFAGNMWSVGTQLA